MIRVLRSIHWREREREGTREDEGEGGIREWDEKVNKRETRMMKRGQSCSPPAAQLHHAILPDVAGSTGYPRTLSAHTQISPSSKQRNHHQARRGKGRSAWRELRCWTGSRSGLQQETGTIVGISPLTELRQAAFRSETRCARAGQARVPCPRCSRRDCGARGHYVPESPRRRAREGHRR